MDNEHALVRVDGAIVGLTLGLVLGGVTCYALVFLVVTVIFAGDGLAFLALGLVAVLSLTVLVLVLLFRRPSTRWAGAWMLLGLPLGAAAVVTLPGFW